jgi:glycosyltransferase involved in cell wall biosynthesis
VHGIIAINSIIVDELKKTFPSSSTHYIVEPNGVDLTNFIFVEKQEARSKLGLPFNVPIVLYAGRFFDWKGLEILPIAAKLSPGIRWQVVGGDETYFKEFVTEPLSPNLFFAGSRPHSEMPLWCAAADAVLVLGTKRDIQSYRYTSPMKLFEYLAAGRPIVVSNTPAINDIVSNKEVLFYEPDNAQDLARTVLYAIHHTEELSGRIASAAHMARMRSWKTRAERIVQFMKDTLHDNL